MDDGAINSDTFAIAGSEKYLKNQLENIFKEILLCHCS